MPALVFTFTELAHAAATEARALSEEILKLSDYEKCPPNPGESDDARRHQIAKLGKRLAQVFTALDEIMLSAHEAMHGHDEHDHAHEPPATEKPEKETN